MYDHKQKEVFQRVAATFPFTFGLRGFPGKTFRISRDSSYFTGPMSSCEECQRGVTWVDFAKGTAAELRAQVVALPR